MNNIAPAGQRLRDALAAEQPLQMVGAINAYCAILAEHAGFRALYLSGAGIANASYGLPDLGLTTLENVLEDIRRVTSATSLPVLVDADTGFDDVTETVERFIAVGAAGLHIEDQISQKRCGHRPNKQLVSTEEMVSRIETAVAARNDPSFVIMARTDAFAVEGFDGALQRIERYLAAGADMIFPEALTDLDQYRQLSAKVKAPILANITEFGKTPLFTREQLQTAGVGIALYPLTAFRAMSAATWNTYIAVRAEGTQQGLIATMQTREELYEHLDYHRYEQELDEKLSHGEPKK
jgi:methylisocitrate lyase